MYKPIKGYMPVFQGLQLHGHHHVILHRRSLICTATAVSYLSSALSKFSGVEQMTLVNEAMGKAEGFVEGLTDEQVNKIIEKLLEGYQ